MTYRLVLTEPAANGTKDCGENVFFANLPHDYKVYALYYGGAKVDDNLEDGLRELGARTGKNLFVNIGGKNDPEYGEVARRFEIKQCPVIIVTAMAGLASPPGEYFTAYARLDGKNLLNSSDRTVECVEELFELFIRGKVAEAIAHAKWEQRAEALKALGNLVASDLRSIGNFIATRDITLGAGELKLELKRSGG